MNSPEDSDGGRTRCVLSADSMPFLPDHVKLHHDATRARWVLLAPERLLEPNETALDTLRLCDGRTTVKDISDKLSETYNMPAEKILGEVITMLQGLADKDFLRA